MAQLDKLIQEMDLVWQRHLIDKSGNSAETETQINWAQVMAYFKGKD